MPRLSVVVLVALAGALIAAGPGAASAYAAHSGPSPNRADDVFAQTMMAHHEFGVQMAQVAAQRGTTPAVRALAARIMATQTREIRQMRGFLRVSRAPLRGPRPAGIQVQDQRERLGRLLGAQGLEIDRLFLMFMQQHHLGGITQAQIEQRSGAYRPSLRLARSIARTQAREAAEMDSLLARLGA